MSSQKRFGAFKQRFSNIFKHKKKHEGTGKVKEFIAKLSRGLMLPIAMLPIAGLFLGIGSAITATAGDGNQIQTIFGNVISAGGNIIFGCLPVLFCIAIAITFTEDVGVAGLSSFVGWIVFCALQSALIITNKDPAGEITSYNFLFWRGMTVDQYNAIFTSNVGISSLSTGVFGGIVVGWCTAFLYNKFKNIQLPQILGFFSGVRFIPIITFLSMIVLSFLFALIWPWIGLAFFYAGSGLSTAPAGLNSLVFGYFNRALVPFGLHHVINTTLWFTSVGGTFKTDLLPVVFIDGHYYQLAHDSVGYDLWSSIVPAWEKTSTITGDINIYIALQQITGKSFDLIPLDGGTLTHINHLSIDAIFKGTAFKNNGLYEFNPGQYTSGAYIFTIFALPAAALAMLMAAPKGDGRKVAASIVVSAAFVCFLTGITEPIEFTFLFLAPWLYWGFHAIMGAIAYMIPTCMALYLPVGWGPHLAFSFSSGFLDFTIYGIVQDAKVSGSNCWMLLIFSAIYAVIYYFMFYWAIKRFDIKTPGRGGQDKLFTKKDYLASKNGNVSQMNILCSNVIKAYGGKENIKNVDACITKLRVQVADQSKVDKKALTELGAKGVVSPSKQSVYAVFGTQADIIKNEMRDIIAGKQPYSVNQTVKAANVKTPAKALTKKTKKNKGIFICAPTNGEIVSTTSVKDETFSQNLMGRGVAFIPKDGHFVAPMAGKVILVNNHAFSIEAPNGVQILVHIGIDTVKLVNKPNVFKYSVKVGDTVKVGQPIVEVDLKQILGNKLDTITPIIVLSESLGNKKIKIELMGHCKPQQKVLEIK